MPTAPVRVFVYWNLHRRLWSVRALEGPLKGRVIDHLRTLTLTDAVGRVGAAGNARVRREGRKNVHAGIVGQWSPRVEWSVAPGSAGTESVTYDPYKDHTFVVPSVWARTAWRGSPMVSMQCISLAAGRTVPAVVASVF
jgi:hypothetical protein